MDDGGSKAARIHQTAVSDDIECRYHGRGFTAAEMSVPRTLIASPERLNRHALSREFRRRIGWYRPDGGLKDMMARVTMLAMHRDGVIELPPPTQAPSPPKPITFGPDTEPPPVPPPASLDRMRPLEVRTVLRGTRHSALWNEFIARYHYLGHTRLVGAQMRYAVHDRNGRPLAMPGFSTAAWRLAPRDRFIGWTPERRGNNLHRVVDNPRFLILPWIQAPNLGSHILALMRRKLPRDWAQRYSVEPVPIETFARDRATPGPSTGPPDGPSSEPLGDAAAMTGTTGSTSRKRISG